MTSKNIGIRELRTKLSDFVERAASGERLIISNNGRPVAQLGPIGAVASGATIDDLVISGALVRPTARWPRLALQPAHIAVDHDARDVLDDLRGRQ